MPVEFANRGVENPFMSDKDALRFEVEHRKEEREIERIGKKLEGTIGSLPEDGLEPSKDVYKSVRKLAEKK